MSDLSPRAQQVAVQHISDYGPKSARQVTGRLQQVIDSGIGINEVRKYLNSITGETKRLTKEKKASKNIWIYSLNPNFSGGQVVRQKKESKLSTKKILQILGGNSLTAKEIADELGGGVTPKEVYAFISPQIGCLGGGPHGPFVSFRGWPSTRFEAYKKPGG